MFLNSIYIELKKVWSYLLFTKFKLVNVRGVNVLLVLQDLQTDISLWIGNKRTKLLY